MGRLARFEVGGWRRSLGLATIALGLGSAIATLAASTFGFAGSNGYNGSNGRTGRTGPSETLVFGSTATSISLVGRDGTNGGDGGDGRDATSCIQPPNVPYDLRGAKGGDGGNGGSGGTGGRGGSLTVYYRDRADLRQLEVDASGGRGGYGGRGGSGGRGCRCRDWSWEVNDRRYYCDDGRRGQNGYSGRDGLDGEPGQLSLVEGSEPLPPEQPAIELSLSELGTRTVELTKDVWEIRRGARSLLAPSSVVADEYREFVERLEKVVEVVWNADRPISDFDNVPVTLSLNEEGFVNAEFSEDLWIDGDATQTSDLVTYTVDRAILASEATQLNVANVVTNANNLELALVDVAQQSHLITTQFQIEYRSTRSISRFNDRRTRTRYEGEVPPELVTQNFNRFTINLSGLPIEDRYLRSGIGVELKITAIRQFAGHQAEQTIRWNGQIQ
ncbi:collagen-like protein [Geitlerinema sp. CS-897]|nr:collagen-like protein [Geitlerinema sp. CS-897]